MKALKDTKATLKKTPQALVKSATVKANEDVDDKTPGDSSTSADPKLSAIKQKSVGEKKVRETQKLVDKLSNDVKEAETQVNTLKKTLDETTDPE